MKVFSSMLVVAIFVSGCNAQEDDRIVSQNKISSIACRPCSIYNWLSHGDERLQGILDKFSADKTPKQTVQHIIDEYGSRDSVTKPGVTRYGSHNGGIGSINQMLVAREILAEHLDEPPNLHGEYLQRLDDETEEEHLKRVASNFRNSGDAGVPVLMYIRGYRSSSPESQARVEFGHHVVVTSIEADARKDGRYRLTFVDPAGGVSDKGFLRIAKRKFTMPTYTFRFKDGRAQTTTKVKSGSPMLEVLSLRYFDAKQAKREIVVAHFATFAESGD